MKKSKIKDFFNKKIARIILALFGIGLVILIWYLLSLAVESHLDCENNIFFPGPNKVFPELFHLMGTKLFYLNIGYTFLRMLLAFLIAFVSAAILGIISGLCKPVYQFLSPLLVTIRTTPTATIVLLFPFLFTDNFMLCMIAITFFVMFPILYEAFVSGIVNIPTDIMQSVRLETSPWNPKALFRVIIPSASPYIFLAMLQTLGLGLKVSIMAELLKGTADSYGIGNAFKYAEYIPDYTSVIAYTLIVIIIIAIVDAIIKIPKKKLKNLTK